MKSKGNWFLVFTLSLLIMSGCVSYSNITTQSMYFGENATEDVAPPRTVAYSRSVEIPFRDGVNPISIIAPFNLRPTVRYSNNGEFLVSFRILSDSVAGVESFRERIQTEISLSGYLINLLRDGRYGCSYRREESNGSVREFVRGACIVDFNVSVPRSQRTRMIFNNLDLVPNSN